VWPEVALDPFVPSVALEILVLSIGNEDAEEAQEG
jgi:hypothetical protein